jgi:RNA polymerase sigma-70 factor (ECF subfamily)
MVMSAADRAFGTELNSYRSTLETRARSMCKCPNEAEDLASVATLKAWHNREKYEPGTNMLAWVSFIMRNEFLTRMRRSKFSGGYVEDLPFNLLPIGPGNQESHMELKDVIKALAHVRDDYKIAMLMVGEGASYEEAAEELMISIGTVKSRVGRGRDALRELLA